jgi:DNA-binding CsgD family transcriptional regulator/DNA-binding transcriptional ArsR family regulator
MGSADARETELDVVRRLLAEASAGHGALVLMAGPPGADASRLLRATADLARDSGFAVHNGRSVRDGGTYRALTEAVLSLTRDPDLIRSPEVEPFRSALARLGPGLGDVESAESDRAWAAGEPDPTVVLGEGILRLLVAAGRPRGSVLVLEDLHWADADTVAVVQFLAGAVAPLPALVVVSVTVPEPTPERPSRPAVVPELQQVAGVVTLQLDRLDQETAGERTDAAAATRQRLAALDEPAGQVARAASVLGEPDWTLLGPATGLTEPAVSAALRSLTEAGLLEAAGSPGPELRWQRSAVRDAVLAMVVPPERVAFARRAADELTARGRPEDQARAADLLVRAGDPDAVRLLLELARRDIVRGALRSAAAQLERAVAAGAAPADVATDQVRVLTLCGRAPEALDIGQAALDLVTGDAHAELCLTLARAAVAGRRWDLVHRLVDRAGRPNDPRTYVLQAEACFGAGDVDRAAVLAQSGVQVAERAQAPEALCAALVMAGRSIGLAAPERSADLFRRAAQVAAEHGLVPWRVEALFALGLAELTSHQPTVSLGEARRLGVEAGLLGEVLSIDLIDAETRLSEDGPLAAEPQARRTAEQASRLGLSGLAALALTVGAAGRAMAGDLAGMESALADAAAQPHVSLEVTALAAGARCLPPLVAHDVPDANQILDAGMTLLVSHGSAAPTVHWGLWVLLRTLVADRDQDARAFLRSAPVGRRDSNRGGLAYAEAVVAGRAGDAIAAEEQLRLAEALLAGQRWWQRLLRLLALESAVVDGWGDPVPMLRTDLAAYDERGEEGFARTCRDLLRQAGAETRRGRGDSTVPLALRTLGVTSREMDVLRLVADGLTNAEVAERLFLSPRTVETHVGNLLAKTGAPNRAGLRAVLGGLTP